MPVSAIALAIAFVFSVWFLGQWSPQEPRTRFDGTAEAMAGNMVVWHQAAVTYADSNPGFTGVVAQSDLVLPSWFQSTGPWVSLVGAGGTVTTYFSETSVTVSAPRLANALGERLEWYAGAGIVSGGRIVAGPAGSAVIAPTGVPNGAVAIVTTLGP